MEFALVHKYPFADVLLAEKGYLSNNLTFVEKRSLELAF
jgi:hypothetical protein